MIDKTTLQLLDFDLADKFVGQDVSDNYDEAKDMYDGDHWLAGAGWRGPTLAATHSLYQETMSSIEEMFLAQNVIKEVVGREVRASGCLSPSLSFVVKREVSEDDPVQPDETELLERVTKAFFTWFNNNQVGQTLIEAATDAALGGIGGIRLVVPSNQLQGEYLPSGIELNQLGRYLFAEKMPAADFAMITDPITKEQVGVFKYETATIDDKDKLEKMERTYLDENGDTIIEIAVKGEGSWKGADAPVPLMGNLSMFSMKRDPLIGTTTLDLQKNLNLIMTMMAKNTLLGGFLERIFLNAQPPQKEVEQDDGSFTYEDDSLTLGANSVSFISGLLVENEETGEVSYTRPEVKYHDPVDPDTFIRSKESLYYSILQEVQQTHVLMTVQTRVSGESRRQARAEFSTAAEITALQVASAMEWLANQFIAYAELMAGESLIEKIEPASTAIVDIGPLPAEEVGELINMREAGMISNQTALTQYGIKNVTRELDRIQTQVEQSIRERESRSKQYLFYTKSGLPPYEAALLSGFGEETANLIKKGAEEQQAINDAKAASMATNVTEDTSSKNAAQENNDDSMTENPLMDRS